MKLFRRVQFAVFSLSLAALSLTLAARADEIATEPKLPSAPEIVWPGGKLLAYCEGEDDNRKIIVVNAEGQKIFTTEGDAPVLSPNGKRIVFTREERYSSDNGLIFRNDLWIANLDGKTPPRALTRTRDGEYSPSWNPAGTQIVFATRPEQHYGNGYGLVEIINADGTKRHRITRDEGATQPSWSPDGKTIAFVKMGICRMDVKGRNRIRLTDGYTEGEPNWSPDGKFLAYSKGEDESVTSRDGRDGPISHSTDGIYIINAAVKVKKRVETRITDSNFDYQNPIWSADGQWILLESDKDGVPLPEPDYDESNQRGPYNIYAMKRDGGSFRRVTLGAGNRQNASWR